MKNQYSSLFYWNLPNSRSNLDFFTAKSHLLGGFEGATAIASPAASASLRSKRLDGYETKITIPRSSWRTAQLRTLGSLMRNPLINQSRDYTLGEDIAR